MNGSFPLLDRQAAIGRRILHHHSTHPPAYRLRLARTAEDVRAAQTLRFIVFNVELGEGLEESYVTCRDADEFDFACDHLLVEHATTGEVVGTYRLQTGLTAAAQHGYYSAAEFDLTPFERWRAEIVELGRACVHSAHRNLVVLGLLWRGIAAYARERDCRFLIGCSSLTSQDHADGATAYAHLAARGALHPTVQTHAHPAFRCRLDEQHPTPLKLPKLLSAYLSLGAKICAPPAVDAAFKTIDFLTLLDLATLPAGFEPLLE
jgi:putative hemolysin